VLAGSSWAPRLRHFATISGARYIELPGDDHLTLRDGDHGVFDDIEEFLTGTRPEPTGGRVLKTVLFTEIVDSTATAARLGDRSGRPRGRTSRWSRDYDHRRRPPVTALDAAARGKPTRRNHRPALTAP
jgi:hypothetical protein